MGEQQGRGRSTLSGSSLGGAGKAAWDSGASRARPGTRGATTAGWRGSCQQRPRLSVLSGPLTATPIAFLARAVATRSSSVRITSHLDSIHPTHIPHAISAAGLHGRTLEVAHGVLCVAGARGKHLAQSARSGGMVQWYRPCVGRIRTALIQIPPFKNT